MTSVRPQGAAYARLEDRILARDQAGAAEVFYQLVREDRPATELIGEIVRIHAPYTHVPYHQRFDDGVPYFVNNDHCLLSVWASMRMMHVVSTALSQLPLAQTVWYVPTGLDPWNQLRGKAPGHYLGNRPATFEEIPPPEIHWPDQEPEFLEGPFSERLSEWLTMVQRGEVLRQYRVFQGLLQDVPNRPQLLAHLVFAGLIDVQDRMLNNRSYTTGHKAYRARATVEIGESLGWANAHHVVYAGVPDVAVGPRWHSTYEMACNITRHYFGARERDVLEQRGELTSAQVEATFDVMLRSHEPVWTHHLTNLLDSGKGPRQIIDVLQLISADLIMQTHDANVFNIPQHCYEYLSTLRWFYDRFEHPHRLKLLYVGASFVNQTAHHQASLPTTGQRPVRPPQGADRWPAELLRRRIEEAILALNPDESVALTAVYLESSFPREALVKALADAAAKIGNDPHNQEIALSMIEDYRRSTASDRERLLLAAAKHTSAHRKYGDPLESYRRFVAALGDSCVHIDSCVHL